MRLLCFDSLTLFGSPDYLSIGAEAAILKRTRFKLISVLHVPEQIFLSLSQLRREFGGLFFGLHRKSPYGCSERLGSGDQVLFHFLHGYALRRASKTS